MTMQPSKWIPRIEAARKAGRFSESDRTDAGSFEHCVVGELVEGLNLGFTLPSSYLLTMDLRLGPYPDRRIPRTTTEKFITDVGAWSTFNLACIFADVVERDDFDAALAITKEMRERGHRYRKEFVS